MTERLNWTDRASPSLAAKNIINMISVSTIWWYPCVESSLCCWKRVSSMTSVFSWKNFVSLCPASFCIPRTNLPVTPGISWLPTFAFQPPIMKRTSFLVLVLKGLVGLHRFVQLQLLSNRGWCIDMVYWDIEWFVLEMNKDHSVTFDTALKNCISDSFVHCDGYSISSKGFLITVVDIMVIWIKFAHSCPF